MRVYRRIALLVVVLLTSAACPGPRPAEPSPKPPPGPGPRVVGYFTEWGVYGRNFQVKDLEASRAAAELTHLVYAFGEVKDGRCTAGDAWADDHKPVSARRSVTGGADPAGGDGLRGTIGQLRTLKADHPGLKILWSFGGWTASAGFHQAAADPPTFAASCQALLDDPRWAGVFDGIDIDWEYPNACGRSCDASGPAALPGLLAALRSAFGPDRLVTAAVPGEVGKLHAGGFAAAAKSVDWLGAMTYDYFGTSTPDGPTAPHSPLTAYPGIPRTDSTTEATIDAMLGAGIPSGKILLGIGFYGRGWTGVTGPEPGGRATGQADGRYEKGIEDYKILASRCPPTGTIGGTAYGYCRGEWWGYDTPSTVRAKMAYAKEMHLGGAFAWELSGDTARADLLNAMSSGLR